ncbi:MAG: OmpA family protein [Acidobacteria bacterium]|nr:OmpA family protein [Acidobacteriota bacterium]
MNQRILIILAVAGLTITVSGCATKKFVRQTTDPINQKVADLDKRTVENAQSIGQLDDKTGKEISRVDEKATAADARAGEAGKLAGDALTKGGQAMERAGGARSLAEGGIARTGRLEQYVANLDNYQPASSKTVYYGFNKNALDDDARKELDELAVSLANTKHFLIVVQGFTDTTGAADYNYTLSEKRAESVVRYLTTKHNIPVYRIHKLGLGKDMPAQAEDKREARRLSRRVEVKAYMLPDAPQGEQVASAQR